MTKTIEKETINGFSIEKRELTEEEATRKLTWERIRDFHYEVGEDFLDNTSIGNELIFYGWILHKYKDRRKEIIDFVNNERYLEIQTFKEIEDLFGYDEETDIDKVYYDYVDFVNETEKTLKEVNQVLIQVMEYYKS